MVECLHGTDRHVTLEIESIDRMYLNGYIPGLHCPGGVAWLLRERRGARFASSMLLDPISRDFERDIKLETARERRAEERRLKKTA